jgi:hypothetical protein
MTQFTFHEDPGHGWLEVTKQQAAAVGLAAEDFTRYSYREGDTWYLEEDSDMTKFARAFYNTNKRFLRDTDTASKRVECESRIRWLPALQ